MANFVFAEGLARLTYSAHASHIEWDAADPTNGLLYAALLTTTIPVDDMSVASVDLIAAAADSVMAAGQDTNLAATERKIQGSDTEDAEHFRQYDASDLLFASVGASTDAAVVSLLVYQCTATAGHGSHDTNHSSHVPICHLDFAIQPDGSNILVQWARLPGSTAHNVPSGNTGGTVIRVS